MVQALLLIVLLSDCKYPADNVVFPGEQKSFENIMIAISIFRLISFGLFLDIMLSVASRRAFTVDSLLSRKGYSALCLIPLFEISSTGLLDKTYNRTLILSILLGFYALITLIILICGIRSLHRVSRL